jgi:hypothetical protein
MYIGGFVMYIEGVLCRSTDQALARMSLVVGFLELRFREALCRLVYLA